VVGVEKGVKKEKSVCGGGLRKKDFGGAKKKKAKRLGKSLVLRKEGQNRGCRSGLPGRRDGGQGPRETQRETEEP